MRYLLDTMVVSELAKRPDVMDPGVRRWAQGVSARQQHISAVSLGELEFGVLRKERDDPPQGQRLRAWLEDVLIPQFAGRTLPLTDEAARCAMTLEFRRTRGREDAYIAGIAAAHSMTVVTRNVKDYADAGVPLLNPWAE